MSYETILKSISLGIEDAPANPMTKTDAYNLMYDLRQRMKGATPIHNQSFETANYYIYIGGFPAVHVAIDNKSGTTRLFTLYNEADFLKLKSKICFV